jgi:hypothetical protein
VHWAVCLPRGLCLQLHVAHHLAVVHIGRPPLVLVLCVPAGSDNRSDIHAFKREFSARGGTG